MKILIYGADGMLGNKLYHHFRSRADTYGTLRDKRANYPMGYAGLDPNQIVYDLDVRVPEHPEQTIRTIRPDVVINAIGAIKQRNPSDFDAVSVNAMLPHRLARACAGAGAKFVQISTDCVYSGRKGGYKEQDVPDATDMYGRSKHLGEVHLANCLTLRTSIVGLEIKSWHGLIEWFLSQRAGCRGFVNAKFSGLTTAAFAKILEDMICGKGPFDGLWHVAAEPISKYDLLCRIDKLLGRDGWVEPEASYHCDRSLDARALRSAFPLIRVPSWDTMLHDLVEEIQTRGGG